MYLDDVTMPLCYSYLRFSTKEQQHGSSRRRQLAAGKAFAARHGLKLVERDFADEGMTGRTGVNRVKGRLGEFLSLVDDSRIKPGSVLVIENFDRFSREAIDDAREAFRAILPRDIRIGIVSRDKIYDRSSLNDPFCLVEMTLEMNRAYEESQRKSVMVRAAIKARREKGTKIAVCPGWLILRQGKDGPYYDPIPNRVQVVRRIYDLADDGLTIGAITRILNTESVSVWDNRALKDEGKVTNGKPPTQWHDYSVSRILQGRAVRGEWQPCRWENGKKVYVGEPEVRYPVVIEEAQWRRVQARLGPKGSRKKGRQSTVAPSLLQGLLSCDDCGQPMASRSRKAGDKLHNYWCCGAAIHNPAHRCAGGRWFDRDQIEALVVDHVDEFALSAALRITKAATKVAKVEEEIVALGDRLAELERSKKRYAMLIGACSDDELPVYREHLGQTLAEIRSTGASLQDARDRCDEMLEMRDRRSDATDEIKRIRRQLRTADATTAYALKIKLKTIVQSIIGMVRVGSDSGTVDVVLRVDEPHTVAYRFQQSGPKKQKGKPRTYTFVGKAQAGYTADINRQIRAREQDVPYLVAAE